MNIRVCLRRSASAMVLAALSALIGGCGKASQPPTPEAAGIAWFEGSVQDAFARARTVNRPVFLYWGAAWCPYCQQLKSSVFTRRDFVEKSRLFVPVYLDGDDPGAQKWGETLRVSGYPTVLILRPDGTELMRVAGGMDVGLYTEILDLALGSTRPVAEILAALESSPAALSADDCRRIAFHGFSLDSSFDADRTGLSDTLWLAAMQCPAEAEVERARLKVMAMTAGIAADAVAIEAGKRMPEQTALQVAAVVELLGNTELAVAVADALFSLDDTFFAAARQAEIVPDDSLLDSWFRVMDAAATEPGYSESDQFFALLAKLQGAKVFGVLSPAMRQDTQARVDAALARDHDPFTRASVVNSILFVLDALDEQDRLYAVAEKEMQTAATPYYYMLVLASIDEKRDRIDAALAWLERAYSESEGPATRFQWGTSYIAGLTRMQPQNESRIRATTLAVLAELDGPDRLYQRTNVRIDRLESTLDAWNADGSRAATIHAIQARMQELCARIPEAEREQRNQCTGFLEAG